MKPLKLTDEVRSKLIEVLRFGLGVATAAALARVGARSVHRWIAEIPEFATDVAAARADGKLYHAKQFHSTECPIRLKAATHYLACMEPGWSQTQKVEHLGEVSFIEWLHSEPAKVDEIDGDDPDEDIEEA